MVSIVLAGGRSRRMGRDKLAELVGGRTLLQRVVDALLPLSQGVIIVTHPEREHLPFSPHPQVRVVKDIPTNSGPLGGIYTGLTVSPAPYAYVVAGDMPFVNPNLLRYMAGLAPGYDVVAVSSSGGQEQPLHGVFSRGCLPTIQQMIDQGELRVGDLLGRVRVRLLSPEETSRFDPRGLSFYNVNSPEQLLEAQALADEIQESALPPIVCIVGQSGSGKTTLLERLVPELKRRGYRVGVVKHSHHSFDIDQPGKDSWRLAQAGSNIVAISSSDGFALMERPAQELPLDEIRALMSSRVDLLLAEGYKESPWPKIEVVGEEGSLTCAESELLAVVSRSRLSVVVAQYAAEDISGVADLITDHIKQASLH